MKHTRAHKQKGQKGFTLVELLIVIVVIAILASISVVAYNGIQNRARNVALLSGMDTLEKAFKIYATQNGQYPKPTDLPGQTGTNGDYSIACIQPTDGSWSEQGSLSSSECYTINGTQANYAGYSAIVNQALLSVVGSIPDTSDYTTAFGSKAMRGIVYQYMVGPREGYPQGVAYLSYGTEGDQDCGRGTKYDNGGNTQCMLLLQ